MPRLYGSYGLDAAAASVPPVVVVEPEEPAVRARRAQRRRQIERIENHTARVSAWVRMWKPMPEPMKRTGSMGSIKRIDLWKELWTEHHTRWVIEVELWLAEQRMALVDAGCVGPHARTEFRPMSEKKKHGA